MNGNLNIGESYYSITSVTEENDEFTGTVVDKTIQNMNQKNKIVAGIIVFVVFFVIFLFGMAAILAFEIFPMPLTILIKML